MLGARHRLARSAAFAAQAAALVCALAGCHGASDCEKYRAAILRLVPRDPEPARPVVYMCGGEVTTYASDARTDGRAAAESACDARGCQFATLTGGTLAHELCIGFVSPSPSGARIMRSTADCDPVWLFGGDVWLPLVGASSRACGLSPFGR